MDRMDETTWVIWIGGTSLALGCVLPWYRGISWGSGFGNVVHWLILLLGIGVIAWSGLRVFDKLEDIDLPVPDALIYWCVAGLSLLILILNPVLSGRSGLMKYTIVWDGLNTGYYFTFLGAIAVAIGGYLSFTSQPRYQRTDYAPASSQSRVAEAVSPGFRPAGVPVVETPVTGQVIAEPAPAPVQAQVPEAEPERQRNGNCPHCCDPLPPESLVCLNCGKQLQPTAKEARSRKVKENTLGSLKVRCPNCGWVGIDDQIDRDGTSEDGFCPQCGSDAWDYA